MTDDRGFVIIGASLAGAKAAETLREEGFDGRITLIGEEPVRPYERPPLSKEYLQGKAEADVAFVHDPAYYDKHDIDLRLSTTVRGLEPAGREVVLASGERLGYDAVLLATGARPRRLAVPGADLAGVHCLRTMADAERLRAAITGANRVVVIGAGWIGCEVAASARQLGADVAVVELGRLPLERVLGPELGAFYRDVHADRNMLGRRTPYERIPYVYSDQYDVAMEYSGYAPGWDQVVFRGDPAGREFIAFWLKDGRAVAGMNVNVWDVADSIAALVAAGAQVDLSRLLDPDVELATLAG
jgi:NADPH-dependent 2,4-dienoyl-CoA reductase/sulfur reductase-like enzyme